MSRVLPFLKFFFKSLALFVLAYIVFVFVLLPTSDMGHLVSSMVSKNTRGTVTLQFENMGFSPLPSVSSSFENVLLKVKGLPSLNVSSFSMSASPLGLVFLGLSLPTEPGPQAQDEMTRSIASNLSADVDVLGLFGGDLNLSAFPDGKAKEGNPLHGLQLQIKDIALPQILKAFKVPFPLKSGTLSGESELKLDYLFAEQPEGKIKLVVDNLHVPSEAVETPAGPLVLPPVQLSSVVANGDIKDGLLQFSQIQLGKGRDNLTGTLNGTFAIRLSKRGNRIQPIIGAYDMNVDVSMTDELHADAELLFLLVSKYKTEENGRVRYAFRVNGPSFQSNPKFSEYRK